MHNLSQSIVLLCALSLVMSGALPADSIAASIDQVQKKFAGTTIEAQRIVTGGTARKIDSSENKITDTKTNSNDNNELALAQHEYANRMQFESTRNDKMLDYYRYFSPTPTFEMPSYPLPFYQQSIYQQPPYMPSFYPSYYSTGPVGMDAGQSTTTTNDEYVEDYSESNEIDGNVDETDDGSRANTRRRPATGKNSPIFYIRLPATPYMFVPGMGYISQPPSIQPLTPQYPINPFINLPVNYLSNAKPNGVFQWNAQQSAPNFAQPQFPPYLPSRPSQKPYRVKPAQQQQQPIQDSKITHLGSYMFNGRPDNIYLMPQPQYHNPYAAHYNPYAGPAMHNPYQTPAMHNPYTQAAYDPYAAPNYNAPAYNTPTYNAPAYNAPAYNPQQTYNQPMYSPPAPIPNYY